MTTERMIADISPVLAGMNNRYRIPGDMAGLRIRHDWATASRLDNGGLFVPVTYRGWRVLAFFDNARMSSMRHPAQLLAYIDEVFQAAVWKMVDAFSVTI